MVKGKLIQKYLPADYADCFHKTFSYVNIKRPTHKVGQVYTKIDIKPSVLTKERLALMKTQMRLLYDDK